MLRLQTLSSPLSITQNPQQHFNPSLPTKCIAFNPTISTKKLSCLHSQHFERPRFPPASTSKKSFASQTSEGAGPFPPRYFVGHSIYKAKAVLTVEPRAPEFTLLDSGSFKLSKEGFVLLQFAPAVAIRQYDWNRKQVFSLSVMEIGTLVSLGTGELCELFHDPFKGRSDEGKVKKVLKVEPLSDGSGHFFNLSVQNKLLNLDESIYIPITRAEFAVLTSAFNFVLPYLLGWHAYANSIKPEDTSRVNGASSRYGGDYKWSR